MSNLNVIAEKFFDIIHHLCSIETIKK